MIAGKQGDVYYKTADDVDARNPWYPPAVVGKLITAKYWNTQPWAMLNRPYSLYWDRVTALYMECDNRANAAVARRHNR